MSASKPLTATFLKSASSLTQCPVDNLLEIAFVGRSNVGKSSTLNNLTGVRNLARVSKTPGRTQLINLFELQKSGTNLQGRLVDLPGYGFARASKAQRAAWGRLVDDYLNRRKNLGGIVLVLDSRHPPFDFDLQMIDWSVGKELKLLILLNKCDKLSRNQRNQTLSNFEKSYNADSNIRIELFSASKSIGTSSVRNLLREWMFSGDDIP